MIFFFLPELILYTGGFLLIFLDLLRGKSIRLGCFLYSSFCFFSLFFCFFCKKDKYLGIFGKIVGISGFEIYASLLFLILGGFIGICGLSFLRRLRHSFAYLGILLICLASCIWAISCKELLTIFILLEIISICSYAILAMERTRSCAEACIKYLIFGLFSSAFFLLGIAMTFCFFSSTFLEDIAKVISSERLKFFCFLLLFVGIGFKIAAFPFCFWVADVFQGLSPWVLSYLSTIPKAFGFLILIKLLIENQAFLDCFIRYHLFFQVLCALTIIYGTFGALRQVDIQRLLGYSGISHVGYMLIGLLVSPSNLLGILFYLPVYCAVNLGIFSYLCIVNKKQIPDLSGLGKVFLFSGFMMAIFLSSLVGFPPLGGFFAKLFVFLEALKGGFTLLVILAVICTIISIFYYFNILRFLFGEIEKKKEKLIFPLSSKILLVLVGVFLILVGLCPR